MAAVKRVQELAARPLVAFVGLFGDRDDVRRDDGGVATVELGVDENGRRIFAPLNGPTYPVDWPPRR